MKKVIILLFVINVVLLGSCTRANKHCKQDARKAKKNNVGWKY